MNFTSIAETLAGMGLPMLARILGGAVAGPVGAAAAGALMSKITSALGLPTDASPDAVSQAISADPQAAAQHLATLEQQATADLAFSGQQIKVDLAEGQSPSVFIAGWRPGFAWTVVAWTNILLGTGWAFMVTGRIDLAQFLAMWQAPWMLFAGLIGVRTAEKWGGVVTTTMRRLSGDRTRLS